MGANLRLGISLSLVIACGGNDDKTCDPVAQSGCSDGKVCEQVMDAEPTCFAPIEIRGKVIDLADSHGIAGARVVAVDVNGAAVSSVAISASDGKYTLPVPGLRNADGTPSAFPVSLRADAASYQGFPGTVRQALPLDVATAAASGDGFVLTSALTDIGLLVQASAPAGSIHGKVAVPDDHAGVLVVAESGGKGAAGIVSRDGEYTIYNLAAAHYAVTAYSIGHVYTPAETDVAAGSVALNLALASDAPGSLTGQVTFADPGGGKNTSVVAFVESTFDMTTGRGIAPPGLRSPRTGAPNVTGSFTIDGVPPGRYVVVAAFENDGLVRDPDHCISGTADVHVQVTAGQATAAPNAFKVTGALAVMTPGAAMAEAVTGAPTFKWADDSSEDLYTVEVFDSFGQRIWMATTPGVSGGTPSLAYAGPALSPGMYYQWRVTSSKKATTTPCELSRSEDLRGVFYTMP
jgi:hypothetical protein